MNKKVFAILVVLVVLALACVCPALQSVGNTPSVNNPPVDIPVPTSQSTLQPPVSSVLFQDDFSNPSSGWDQAQNDKYLTDYANGSYRINVIPSNYTAFANPYQSFQNDVRIEVDTNKIGGPDDNAFGVICRYQDVDNFYLFLIRTDGYAGIGMYKNNAFSLLSSDQLQPVNGIQAGTAPNHIRADCIGTTLTLYANGQQVATTTDSSFTGGDVGLGAKSNTQGGVDILFTNFFVYKP